MLQPTKGCSLEERLGAAALALHVLSDEAEHEIL